MEIRITESAYSLYIKKNDPKKLPIFDCIFICNMLSKATKTKKPEFQRQVYVNFLAAGSIEEEIMRSVRKEAIARRIKQAMSGLGMGEKAKKTSGVALDSFDVVGIVLLSYHGDQILPRK